MDSQLSKNIIGQNNLRFKGMDDKLLQHHKKKVSSDCGHCECFDCDFPLRKDIFLGRFPLSEYQKSPLLFNRTPRFY